MVRKTTLHHALMLFDRYVWTKVVITEGIVGFCIVFIFVLSGKVISFGKDNQKKGYLQHPVFY